MEQDRNIVRSNMFLAGAEEIAKLGKLKRDELVVGRINACVDAIKIKLGKSPADLGRNDERTVEMLQIATADAFGVRVRSTAHLFNLLNKHSNDLLRIRQIPKVEQQKGEALFRNIHARLSNGYAGCDI